jgi:tetratricopeptide (TPR) repeat protein
MEQSSRPFAEVGTKIAGVLFGGLVLVTAFLLFRWYVNRLMEDDRQASEMLSQARLMSEVGNWDGAIQQLDKLLQKDPARATAWLSRGRAHLGKGNLDAALKDLEQALAVQQRRDDPEFRLNVLAARGDVHMARKDLQGALDDYTEGIRIQIKCEQDAKKKGLGWIPGDFRPGMLHLKRAMAHDALDDYDKAIEDCAEALKINPKLATPTAAPALAKIYLRRGVKNQGEKRYNAAIIDLTTAIELNPQDASAYFFRGMCYFQKGDHIRSKADQEEAARLDPKLRIGK